MYYILDETLIQNTWWKDWFVQFSVVNCIKSSLARGISSYFKHGPLPEISTNRFKMIYLSEIQVTNFKWMIPADIGRRL